jgi:hypothetical protein
VDRPGAVFVACYFAWSGEHDARVAAERGLKAAQDKLAEKQLSKAKLAQLQKFYEEAGPIIDANLPKDISTQDFEKWVVTAQAWVDTTDGWIKENLGPAAAARFTDQSDALTFKYFRAVNPKHNARHYGIKILGCALT